MTLLIKNKFLLMIIFLVIVSIIGIITFVSSKKETLNYINQLRGINQAQYHSIIPVASNQWYSSIYSAFPTQPIYALPISYQVFPDGLSFSYPTVVKTPKTIFASNNPDFIVGYNEVFEKPKVISLGDWSIGVRLESKDKHDLKFTLAHGVPFTVLHPTTDLIVHLKSPAKIYINENTQTDQNLITQNNFMVEINNHEYIFVLNKAQNVSIDKTSITIPNTDSVFIGLLDKKANYNLFMTHANTEILSTQAQYGIEENNVNTTYNYLTSGETPLITLYPHQSNFLKTEFSSLGTYATIRGPLQLVEATSFTTSLPLPKIYNTYPPLKTNPSDLVENIKQDIQTYIKTPQPNSKDYFLGTWLGKGDNLLLLSDMVGLKNERDELLKFLESKFTVAIKDFKYDKEKTSLIAAYPEFGNEKLNDHHFHYGYYIRTAAILSQFDPAYADQINDDVNEMVNDIATFDRTSIKYPYLRNFDVYEGHSWADGFGNFGDGNNQESSSEAINAWYSLYLWGEVTGDKQLSDTAKYLYATEIQSIYYYWFGLNNQYTEGYNHAIASIVWGGKVDFSTWFSGETNSIYGIQLLPFTPGSMYLGDLPDFNKYKIDFYGNGGAIEKEWGDLYVMWDSFYNPKEAFSFKDKVKKLEANNTKSNLLYFLYYNLERK